ncbi:MAG: undecaprenyl-diphosphatase [Deltaproteobacteria bacterium RBG_13_43_22]|nr:MAG: undecaprenyl-diphosphatase [Deltaproteobacteria bacterium RBG_13_43_22]
MFDYWTAVLLGLVEGLTEFIPVSSTGHLILAGHLLHFKGRVAETFDIVIQLGAILAVVILYRQRFIGLLPQKGWLNRSKGNAGFSGFQGCLLLGLTTLPALIMGKSAYPYIKGYLFNPSSVAVALAVGALGILAVEKWRPGIKADSLDAVGWLQALIIGLFQCLSMWPGISRAGATIIGGLLSGLDRKTAAEYSFLAAVPVMVAATGYDLYKTWSQFQEGDLIFLGIGFAVSFVIAYFTVAAFIRILGRWTLKPFAWYRIALAPLVLLFWPD